MTSDRFDRVAPLTGVLFVALVVVGGPVLEGTTPGAHASGAHVISFYAAHRSRERAGAVVLALAFVAFLFFAGTLRARWRHACHSEALTAVILAAATVLVAGQTTGAGVGYALSQAPASLTTSTAQTLNLLANDLVLTSAVGFFTFGIAAGLVALRGGTLPAWLGWLAIAFGVLSVTPIEFLAFVLLLVWTLSTSVVLVRKPRSPAITTLQADPA